MKFLLLLLKIGIFVWAGPIPQLPNEEFPFVLTKEANKTMSTLSLPSNATAIRGDISDNFSCKGKPYGYYADVENECQIFHVCLPVEYPSGKARSFRWSFICPEETVFSQEIFTCVRMEDLAIDCKESERYYDLNSNFGGTMDSDEPTKEESVSQSLVVRKKLVHDVPEGEKKQPASIIKPIPDDETNLNLSVYEANQVSEMYTSQQQNHFDFQQEEQKLIPENNKEEEEEQYSFIPVEVNEQNSLQSERYTVETSPDAAQPVQETVVGEEGTHNTDVMESQESHDTKNVSNLFPTYFVQEMIDETEPAIFLPIELNIEQHPELKQQDETPIEKFVVDNNYADILEKSDEVSENKLDNEQSEVREIIPVRRLDRRHIKQQSNMQRKPFLFKADAS